MTPTDEILIAAEMAALFFFLEAPTVSSKDVKKENMHPSNCHGPRHLDSKFCSSQGILWRAMFVN